MAELKNDVGYSASRAGVLAECPRRFLYQVYIMWGGWWSRGRPPPERAAEAYRAKFAGTAPMWAGKLVHEAAERALKQAMRNPRWLSSIGGMVGIERQLHSWTSEWIERGLDEARRPDEGNPKERVQLVELNLGRDVDSEWINERVHSRIKSLCAPDEQWTGSPSLFRRALEAPDRIVSVETLEEFRIDGLKVWTKLDMLARAAHDPACAVVVDWKTGDPAPKDRPQLGLYSATTKAKRWRRVMIALAYIGAERTTVEKVEPTAEDDEAAFASVRAFFADLRERLVGKDLGANIPVEDKFEPTSDPRRCLECPHAMMCERDGTKPRALDPGAAAG